MKTLLSALLGLIVIVACRSTAQDANVGARPEVRYYVVADT